MTVLQFKLEVKVGIFAQKRFSFLKEERKGSPRRVNIGDPAYRIVK